ncbi:MAG: hypothetical protein LBD24_01050 [Spirochaetaceae bacterium]|nr:hypothetical protein [Spirochaetaceae bacterium]
MGVIAARSFALDGTAPPGGGKAQAEADRFEALKERLALVEKGGGMILPDEYALALDVYTQGEAAFKAENYAESSARYQDAITQFQDIGRLAGEKGKKEAEAREAAAYRVAALAARLALLEKGGDPAFNAEYAEALGSYEKGERAFLGERYAEALAYYDAALDLFQAVTQTVSVQAIKRRQTAKQAGEARIAALQERISLMEIGGFRGRSYDEALAFYDQGERAFKAENYEEALLSYTETLTRFQDIKEKAGIKQREARQALINTAELLGQRESAANGRR